MQNEMKLKEIKKLLNEVYDTIGLTNEDLEDYEGDYVPIDIDDMRYINSLLALIDMTICE